MRPVWYNENGPMGSVTSRSGLTREPRKEAPVAIENPTTTETWRPVVGYEGMYEVSDLGRVRSLPTGKGKRPCVRLLRGRPIRHGYLSVALYRGDGIQHCVTVHRLVAEAFVPRLDASFKEINHLDAVKTNNSASNLEWCDHTRNMRHAEEMGRMNRATGDRNGLRAHPESVSRGERNGWARLTEEDIRDIRMALASGEQGNVIAARFGCSAAHISRIGKRMCWSHVL